MRLSILWLLHFLLHISMEAIAISTNSTAIIPKTMLTATETTKADCQKQCGNLTIPYPFGVGPECALDAWFIIKCDNTTYNPPKAFLETLPDLKDREILDITETEVVIRNKIASKCYRSQVNEIPERVGNLNILGSPFSISHTANKLTAIGCNDYAMIGVFRGNGSHETPFYYGAGCMAMCAEPDKPNEVIPGSCAGLGCCQTSVPVGLQKFQIDLYRFSENPHNKTISELQPCTYAFFAKEGSFSFGGASDLAPNGTVFERTMQKVPVVLNWAFERSTSLLRGTLKSQTMEREKRANHIYMDTHETVFLICSILQSGCYSIEVVSQNTSLGDPLFSISSDSWRTEIYFHFCSIVKPQLDISSNSWRAGVYAQFLQLSLK